MFSWPSSFALLTELVFRSFLASRADRFVLLRLGAPRVGGASLTMLSLRPLPSVIDALRDLLTGVGSRLEGVGGLSLRGGSAKAAAEAVALAWPCGHR